MIFSNKDVVNSNIVFNNALINQVTKTTFLGVIIDNKLSWRHHCQKIHLSISRTLGVLRRVRNMLPREALFSIYNALILPQLQYGILAWGNSSQLNLNKLLVVQKKSLRVINRSDYRAHALPLFVKYNTLPLHDLYQYELGVLMFKNNMNLLSPLLLSLFTKNSEIHHYDTRSSKKLHFYRARKSKFLSTVRHQGPIKWNKLSPVPPLNQFTVLKDI